MGCAALTLAALVVGYYAANELSGIASSTRVVVFWIVAAAIAGPPLGLSAHWVRGGGPTAAAVGSGIPAGVLIGEGVYGLRYIADTTYRPFWWGEIVLGVALLGVLGGIRLRSARRVALSLCVALAVSAAFVVIYSNGLIGLL
jgi:hypothetical protein